MEGRVTEILENFPIKLTSLTLRFILKINSDSIKRKSCLEYLEKEKQNKWRKVMTESRGERSENFEQTIKRYWAKPVLSTLPFWYSGRQFCGTRKKEINTKRDLELKKTWSVTEKQKQNRNSAKKRRKDWQIIPLCKPD